MQPETEARPLYCYSSEPALKDYHPKWLDSLAADATLEGSMLDGIVQGADGVRSVVSTIRSFYEHQAHRYAGPSGDGGFLEEYVAQVRGEDLGCVVLVSYNDAGEAQHVVASYRPRTAVINFARILAEKFYGTPIAAHFADATRGDGRRDQDHGGEGAAGFGSIQTGELRC